MTRVVSARGLAILAAAAALSGCANVVDTSPSYLGVSTGAISDDGAETAPPASRKSPAAIRHVSSNRVLGAMAFKKVTGAEVDPERLVERGD